MVCTQKKTSDIQLSTPWLHLLQTEKIRISVLSKTGLGIFRVNLFYQDRVKN